MLYNEWMRRLSHNRKAVPASPSNNFDKGETKWYPSRVIPPVPRSNGGSLPHARLQALACRQAPVFYKPTQERNRPSHLMDRLLVVVLCEEMHGCLLVRCLDRPRPDTSHLRDGLGRLHHLLSHQIYSEHGAGATHTRPAVDKQWQLVLRTSTCEEEETIHFLERGGHHVPHRQMEVSDAKTVDHVCIQGPLGKRHDGTDAVSSKSLQVSYKGFDLRPCPSSARAGLPSTRKLLRYKPAEIQ